MDLKSQLHRFDARSRLLVHALCSGADGARNARAVFIKQRRSDEDFTLTPLLATLFQEEACVVEDCLVLKPLVCLLPESFKMNLLCFLHHLHPELPRDSVLHLIRCLNQDPGGSQWVCALTAQLHRDVDDTVKNTLLSSNCTMRIKSLCERFRSEDTDGGWASCLQGMQEDLTHVSALTQKKRKSENMDHDAEDMDDICQSKKIKMDFSPAKEVEKQTKESNPSQPDQNFTSDSQGGSRILGSSKVLPDHLKAALPEIKEILNLNSVCDESSFSALGVLHECDTDEVELLCSALELSQVPEQSLPRFCRGLLGLTLDLSHSTASALIANLLLHKVQTLTEPPSRSLVTTVTSLCSRYPRPSCQALIEPVLRKGHIGSPQAEMLCRLLDCLEPYYKLLVFQITLEISWDEGVLSVIHALLDAKLELKEEDFSRFTDHLCNQASQFSKSAKFSKMMLSVLTKYQSCVTTAIHHSLSSCLSLNETFLKKSLQAALKRISL